MIFFHSRIPDPTTAGRRGRQNFCFTFFVAINFYNIKQFYFWTGTEKIWDNWQRIKVILAKKIVIKLSEIWIWDPGKTYPGFEGQKSIESRVRIRSIEILNIVFLRLKFVKIFFLFAKTGCEWQWFVSKEQQFPFLNGIKMSDSNFLKNKNDPNKLPFPWILLSRLQMSVLQ